MLITAETIPDQTPVSNCPANRKEPDSQPNQWLNLEAKKIILLLSLVTLGVKYQDLTSLGGFSALVSLGSPLAKQPHLLPDHCTL